MLFPLDPPAVRTGLKKYEIFFRTQGEDTVSDGDERAHGELAANAVSSSSRGRLMWVLLEHHFIVYSRSREEAIDALREMCFLLRSIASDDPSRIKCAEVELSPEEQSFVKRPGRKSGSICEGSVLAQRSQIVEAMPLGLGQFPRNFLRYS